MEKYAIHKFPVKGKCSKPALKGHHRCGMVPVYSVIDNGAPGDICRTFCLECGKAFEKSCFVLRDQPARIGDYDDKK